MLQPPEIHCALCWNPPTNPRILDCLHSFCQSCIETIATDEKSVACPTCGKETQFVQVDPPLPHTLSVSTTLDVPSVTTILPPPEDERQKRRTREEVRPRFSPLDDVLKPKPKKKKESKGAYRCKVCGEAFPASYYIANHMSRKHPKKPFKKYYKAQQPNIKKRGRRPSRPVEHRMEVEPPSPIEEKVPDVEGEEFAENEAQTSTQDMAAMLEETTFEQQSLDMSGDDAYNHKIEVLRMLRHACDQGLITMNQFLAKQEEFLKSISF
jgi:DNA-directed RNA polymerase subunit M/transcription elongation factor TFIIS